MKKLAIIAGAITLSCLAGAAQAQNWYVGGYGAMNYTHDGDANGNEKMVYDLGFGVGGMVGYAMASVTEEDEVPWHRVLNSRGEVSERSAGDGAARQRKLLRAEGVSFNRSSKLDLDEVGWLPRG